MTDSTHAVYGDGKSQIIIEPTEFGKFRAYCTGAFADRKRVNKLLEYASGRFSTASELWNALKYNFPRFHPVDREEKND